MPPLRARGRWVHNGSAGSKLSIPTPWRVAAPRRGWRYGASVRGKPSRAGPGHTVPGLRDHSPHRWHLRRLPCPYKNSSEIVVWNCPEMRGFPSAFCFVRKHLILSDVQTIYLLHAGNSNWGKQSGRRSMSGSAPITSRSKPGTRLKEVAERRGWTVIEVYRDYRRKPGARTQGSRRTSWLDRR